MECVVLAGGMGTRLRSVVRDLPKCMAPVAGRPFLAWLLDDLLENGFDHIILSLGHLHEAVEEWVAQQPFCEKVTCTVESEPLGTGGGMRNALTQCVEEDIIVLNGDTLFKINYTSFGMGIRLE